ncbi:hypothetical protein J6590_015569 [Homalodisca vitripennis]|nr:hypothetical protein J6590_015569 [Homalodisca vitripennis]
MDKLDINNTHIQHSQATRRQAKEVESLCPLSMTAHLHPQDLAERNCSQEDDTISLMYDCVLGCFSTGLLKN